MDLSLRSHGALGVAAIDRRKRSADEHPQRRYEDAKAASGAAADRIARAAREVREAMSTLDPDDLAAA